MRIQLLDVRLIITAALVLLNSTSAYGQSFVYIGADPSFAKGDFMSTSDATLDGDPFWEVMEKYIGKAGRCRKPTKGGVVRVSEMSKENPMFGQKISQGDIDAVLRGFKRSRDWMESVSIWPLPNTRLIPTDPRAPKSIPVFCSIELVEKDPVMMNTISNEGFDAYSNYFVIDSPIPRTNSGGPGRPNYYKRERLATSASFSLMQTLLSDANLAGYKANDGVFFGSDKPLDGDNEALTSFKTILRSLFTAMVFTAAEHEYGFGPSVIKKALSPHAKVKEQEFYYLEGDQFEPFHLLPKSSDTNRKGAAFWNLLFDGYLEVGFEAVPGFLQELIKSSNLLKTINEFIDRHDGDLSNGLVHAIPNLAAATANLVVYRKYHDLSRYQWVDRLYGECPKALIGRSNPNEKLKLEIEPYSSRCVWLYFNEKRSVDIFDVHIEASTSDKRVDGVELGVADFRLDSYAGMRSAEFQCYKHLGYQTGYGNAKKTVRKGWVNDKACLLNFNQGDSPTDKHPKRYFYLHAYEEDNPEAVDENVYLLIASYTPEEHAPNQKAVELDLTFSADIVQLESVLFEEKSVVSVFGSKDGNMPIIAPATEKTSQFDEGVMEGRTTAVDPSLLNSVSSFADSRIGVRDDQNTSIQFKFNDSAVLDIKATGEFEA
ncbi:MAG: hypothetical protein AAF197_11125, partial [Pseudomonadota bacterium]